MLKWFKKNMLAAIGLAFVGLFVLVKLLSKGSTTETVVAETGGGSNPFAPGALGGGSGGGGKTTVATKNDKYLIAVPKEALEKYKKNDKTMTVDELASLGWPFIAESWLCWSQNLGETYHDVHANFPIATKEQKLGLYPGIHWSDNVCTKAAMKLDPNFNKTYCTYQIDRWNFYVDVLKQQGRPGYYAIP